MFWINGAFMIANKRNYLYFLYVGLIIFSSNVYCGENWVKYDEGKAATSYIDINSIRNDKVTSNLTVMNMHYIVVPTGPWSSVMLSEFKCLSKEFRLIKSVGFTEHFGSGNPIGRIITPASIGENPSVFHPVTKWQENHYNSVCNRRR
jgi:hypothetical protein